MTDIQRAIILNKNVMIRACAGAGKTFALTKRYIYILDDFARESLNKPVGAWKGPRNILVITFTKKATAEMAKRIYDDIYTISGRGEIKDSGDISNFGMNIKTLADKDDRYIPWLQREFHRAQIMTIDAFCHRVLVENPIQAGIDPGISTEEEADVRELVNIARSDFIKELAREYDPDLKELIDGIGLYSVKQYLLYLDDHLVELEHIVEFLENSDEFIFKKWRNLYEPEDLSIDDVVVHFKELTREIGQKGLCEKISDQWKEYEQLIDEYENCPENEHFSYYAEKIHPLFLTGRNYRKTVSTGNQDEWKEAGFTADNKKAFDLRVKDFLALLNDNLPLTQIDKIFTSYDKRAIPLMRALMKVYEQYSDYLEKRKRQEGVLTFKDVINKTRQLLENPSIAQKHGDRYEHIMVDEFHDTNDLRWDIIKSIASGDGELRRKGVFLVGDEKQSIYRFQNADVTVLNRARKDLEETGCFNLVEFDQNYRSSEWLIEHCINPLFENILYEPGERQNDDSRPEYEAEFQKTFYPKNKSKRASDFDRTIGSFFDIDILAVPTGQKEEFKKDSLSYARRVAKLVKDVLAKIKDNPEWKTVKGTPRIGILLRQVKTNSMLFREAFREEGVELEIVGGRGFWERQEVMDIEAVLSFLINPLDDVATITLLRSPIFAFDDIAINRLLSKERNGKSIYEVFTREYRDVKTELENWIQESKYAPIDRLLYDIFENNHRDLGYFSETDARQRWANIRKCIDIIHTWSVRGWNISHIRKKIRGKINQGIEGDFADLPTSSDVVLMSIHQAKGLEFPIVVIPDLQRNFQFSRSSSILLERLFTDDGDSRSELGITINTIEGEAGSTTLLKILKNQVKAEEFAEYKRLLYVAVTRAKYGVLLSGYLEEQKNGYPELKEPGEAKNFLDWVRTIYDIGGDSVANETQPQTKEVPNITIHQYKAGAKGIQKPETVRLELLDQQTRHPTFKRVKVHDLLGKFEGRIGGEREEILSGIPFGNLIHKIFKEDWFDYEHHWGNIAFWAEREEDGFDVARHEAVLKKYLDRLRERSMTQKILTESEKFPEHQVTGLICSEDRGRVYELTGVIDLLYKDDNEWVVLDYKTDQDRLQQQRYEKQIQFYLQAVKYVYGFERVRGEIFYTYDGTILPVEFQENYFSQFEFDGVRGWELFPEEKVPGGLRHDFPEVEDDTVILCPTGRWANELKMTLARQRKLLPSHQILSPGNVEEIVNWDRLRKPSRIVKRMLLRKILNNEYEGKNFNEYAGLLSSIITAFDLVDQGNLKLQKGIEKYYRRYKDALKENNFCTDIIPLVEDQIDWSTRHLIIDGCISLTDKEIALYEALCRKANKVSYLPLNNELQHEYDYDLRKLSFGELKIPGGANYHYYGPFDMEEELDVIATTILQEKEKGTDYTDMLIVLPSMELYVPRLLNVFRRNNIPVTLTKREPVLERPAIQALMALLKLIQDDDPDWQTVRTWFTHPLGASQIPDSHHGDFENNLKKLDIVLRRGGKERLSETDDVFFSTMKADKDFPKHYINCAKNGRNEMLECLKSIKGDNDLAAGKRFDVIIQSVTDGYTSTDEMEIRSLDEFAKSLKHLNRSIEDAGLTLSGFVFQHELEDALAGIEIPTFEQEWGIQVVSVPDSTNIRRKILFALGLSQSDFPSISEGNFLIDGYEDYRDVPNRLIFQSWFENFGEVYLTCPEKDSDGKDQQASVFLEPLDSPEVLPSVFGDTNLSRKKKTIGKEIQCETDDPILKRQIDRHNVLLTGNPLDTIYFGLLGTRQDYLVRRPLSASQLDELANKPLYFLMRRGWNIVETDIEVSEAMQRGSIIHEVLEGFGKLSPEDGWTINRNNPQLGRKKMSEVFQATLDRKQLKIDTDLEAYATYYPFILETDGGDSRGLLLRILEEDLVRIKNFRFISAEQGFGVDDGWDFYELDHPTLGLIKFRGRIDRIDKNEEMKRVVAVDFKTGRIDWKPVEEYRAFQLPLYYQVLKREFPDQQILISFRQAKSLKDQEYGFSNYWLGDLDDSGAVDMGVKKNKRHLGNRQVIGFRDKILECLNPIEEGKFRLFAEGSKPSEVRYNHLHAASRLNTVRFIVEPAFDKSTS